MTRINLVDPSELYDQHLAAERVEILMLCGSLKRSLASKRGIDPSRIPSQYTLNRGHVTFFYDKGLYLHKRYNAVTKEMIRRGFKPDLSIKFPADVWPDHLYNDWHPSPKDFRVIRERISTKIAMKPDWYRKTPVVKRVVPSLRVPVRTTARSANF